MDNTLTKVVQLKCLLFTMILGMCGSALGSVVRTTQKSFILI